MNGPTNDQLIRDFMLDAVELKDNPARDAQERGRALEILVVRFTLMEAELEKWRAIGEAVATILKGSPL